MDYHTGHYLLKSLPMAAVNPQSTVFLVVLLLILLLLSFIASGAEVALFSLQPKDINMLKTKAHPAARRITELLNERKAVYASLLVAGTVFNICIILLFNYLVSPLLHVGVLQVGVPVDGDMLIKTVLIAFILVFIGRMLPKVWAQQNNLRFAYSTSAVVEGLHLLLRQVSLRLVDLADSISEHSGVNEVEATSLRELDDDIEINNVQTTVEEKNILRGIVKFSHISVRQIMRFRLDVSGVEYSTNFSDLKRCVEELHYSRLPVYRKTLDEVAGILNTKDLLPHLQEESFDWRVLIRPTLFVPETKLIKDLLKEFQAKRIHFAIVVDEFGGTSGIVTMEDILEEIIGDIRDEFDEEENIVRKEDDRNYLADARVMLHDLCRAMRLPIDTFDPVRGESETLAGLVLELAGELPQTGQVVRTGDFSFTVLAIERNRIGMVRVTINIDPNEY